jgi:pyridoxine 5-phosphate synthase
MAEIDLPLNLEMAATEEMLAIALATARTPPASSPKSARSGPPRAGSTPPASTITSLIMSTSSAPPRTSASACSSSRPSAGRGRDPARRAGRRVPHRPLRPCRRRGARAELKRIADCAALAAKNGIEPHAGHGLTFDNVVPVAAIPQLAELNIGHFLVGEAIFTGLDASVRADARADGRGAMIVGIGSDLCNIERIQKSLDRFGDRFLNRVFTDTERAKARRARTPAPARWPSASPPRRLSPRRSAPASSAACS